MQARLDLGGRCVNGVMVVLGIQLEVCCPRARVRVSDGGDGGVRDAARGE